MITKQEQPTKRKRKRKYARKATGIEQVKIDSTETPIDADCSDSGANESMAIIDDPAVDLTKATDISKVEAQPSDIEIDAPPEMVDAEPIEIEPYIAPENDAPRGNYSGDNGNDNGIDYTNDPSAASYKVEGMADVLSIVLSGIDGFLRSRQIYTKMPLALNGDEARAAAGAIDVLTPNMSDGNTAVLVLVGIFLPRVLDVGEAFIHRGDNVQVQAG